MTPTAHNTRGRRIGLLGGSFDPAHLGHVHITLEALKRFDLDAVWWLVSPGNPLKTRGPAPMERRMVRARDVMQHPSVHIGDSEAQLGTRYTAETLRALRHKFPAARFTWLMGADNLAQFHLWKDWDEIINTVPIGVLARPGDRIEGRTAPAAQIYRHALLKGRQERLLSMADAPAWAFVNVPMRDISSTVLRASGDWPT
ncbi:nicotinate-nucleotide adenylyltransferase [Planktotalea sp.]|uniref:nicotinate-nucleotide adenylyltransferase n=1 Tax=Planktotalea sp. TaxID=2029877 RepID=UPI0025DD4250|nr:nicotinate-nucleotide adenylyltransferase [Planktotalea sp.]